MKSGIDQVAHKTYTRTGRSQTALLDEPYAFTCSFLQENERTDCCNQIDCRECW